MFVLLCLSLLIGNVVSDPDIIYKHNIKTICEGDTATITCGSNELIRIMSASYGRSDSTTCFQKNHVSNTNCSALNSTWIVTEMCNDRRECSLNACSCVFGDPCKGTKKYLKISYNCVPISRCGTHKKFTVCAPICPTTCPPQIMTFAPCGCKPGCVCEEGYVLDVKSNKCVVPERCPYYNPKHTNCTTPEQFSECNAYCYSTCQVSSALIKCAQRCIPGYICKEGYIRDAISNRCIREEDCPCKD